GPSSTTSQPPSERSERAAAKRTKRAQSTAGRGGLKGLAVLGRRILEPGVLLDEVQVHGPDRPVALLADDDLGLVLDLAALLFGHVAAEVPLLAVDEHDHVGVLLDGPGLAQVRQLRAVIGPRVDGAVELRERDDRDLELLGQRLEPAADLADLLLARVV